MIIPDVNLLLYAEIDAYPQHRLARKWTRRFARPHFSARIRAHSGRASASPRR